MGVLAFFDESDKNNCTVQGFVYTRYTKTLCIVYSDTYTILTTLIQDKYTKNFCIFYWILKAIYEEIDCRAIWFANSNFIRDNS